MFKPIFLFLLTILIICIIIAELPAIVDGIKSLYNCRGPHAKKLVKYENLNGSKYYKVFFNGRDTEIVWDNYDDAVFMYAHLSMMPQKYELYSSLEDTGKYYKILLDNVYVWVVTLYRSTASSYKSFSDDGKLVYSLESAKEHNYDEKRLEDVYNYAQHSEYEETVIMSTKEDEVINKRIENAVESNDIKQLRELIQEYKGCVGISMKVAQILTKSLANDIANDATKGEAISENGKTTSFIQACMSSFDNATKKRI